MNSELLIHVLCLILPLTVIARLPDLRCDIHYHILSNQHSNGGDQLDIEVKMEKCLEYCLDSTDCVAFDYSGQTRKCRIHNMKDIEKTEYRNGTNQYRVSRCYSLLEREANGKVFDNAVEETSDSPIQKDCYVRWLAYPNVHSTGGKLIREQITMMECLKMCIQLPDCRAADYKESELKCYIHNHANYHHIITLNMPATWQFRMIRCPAKECKLTYDYYKGFQSIGGTLVLGLRSEAQCLESCVENDFCLAVDFNILNNLCYFHVDQTTLDYEVFPTYNVVQYRLNRCRECTMRILRYNNRATSVKVHKKCNVDIETCWMECAMSKRHCYAAEYDTQGLTPGCCLLHYEQRFTLYQYNLHHNGTSIVVLERCPGKEKPFSFTQCHKEWDINLYVRFRNGVQVAGKYDIPKCLKVCEDHPGCSAADYDTASSTCYVHFDPKEKLVVQHERDTHNFINYVLLNRCYIPSSTHNPRVATENVIQRPKA